MTTIETTEFYKIADKAKVFGAEIPNASIHKTLDAMLSLTDVEFRMWLVNCKTFENFDPSHFKGLEAAYIATGKWALPDSGTEEPRK